MLERFIASLVPPHLLCKFTSMRCIDYARWPGWHQSNHPKVTREREKGGEREDREDQELTSVGVLAALSVSLTTQLHIII